MSDKVNDETTNDSQPAGEMQAEISDLIEGLSGMSIEEEDAEADAIINDLEDGGELEDENVEEGEQENEEGEAEDLDPDEGEEEELEAEDEREDEDKGGEEDGEKGEEESPGEVAVLNERIDALMDFMTKLQPAQPAASVTPVKPDTPPAAATPASDPAIVDLKTLPEDILGDLDIDDVVGNKDLFNKVMTDYAKRIVETTVQQTLLAIPKITTSQIQQQTSIKGIVDDFYRENKDLEGVKPTVGAAANQVAAENPTWKLEQILDEAATRTRKMYGLRKQAVDQDEDNKAVAKTVKKSSPRKPGVRVKKPGASRRVSSQPKVSKLQAEINELIE